MDGKSAWFANIPNRLNKHIYMDVVGWSGEIFKCSKVVVEGFALFYLSEQIKGKKWSVSILVMWYFNWCLLLLVFDYRNFERQKLIWSFLLVIFNNKLLYWFGIIAWNKTSIQSNFILSCSLYRSLHLHPSFLNENRFLKS